MEGIPIQKSNANSQGLSQDLEIGSPKLLILKNLAVLFFQGDHHSLRLQPQICIYLFEISHNILTQCHWKYVKVACGVNVTTAIQK